MADKMIFPIGFDLEAAVKGAGDDWEKKYAKKLEGLIAKRPINVKLSLDTSKLDNLEAVKKRLAELRIEPITPETKTAIKELARELQALAKALELVQKYSKVSTRGTVDASKVRVNEERAKAQAALAAQRAARAEYNLAAARDKDAQAATRGTTTTRTLNKAYQAQDGYISRLIRRMAVYAGFRQIKSFLTNVREVTAQFELQRVSLGAIIQDQTRANQLFAEIKSFALKSPVSILDLTKYTKQLAAYKIGVDDLFETTKKLTDVSVGLGVSMDRVVLAYGQTRATGYLRASEIRQFTEMGVPIVEELAAKLSKMNGELVTAAQVMDMVSKRAISFEMVKEVFDDMTSAGGIFYNMQEKQGNTLYGMWAKLGDAASVMYSEIGNTGPVNSAMKGVIQLLTDLMKNWKATGMALAITVPVTLLAKRFESAYKSAHAAQAAAVKATKARIAAQEQLDAVLITGTEKEIENARATLAGAQANEAAARSAAKRGTASRLFSGMKSLLSGAIWTAAIAGVATLVYNLFKAGDAASRLKGKLSEISNETTILQDQSERNFKRLADVVVNSVDGTKEQKEALDELHRTYKDMIPTEELTIENLRSLNGEYQSLTQAVREYISEQQRQKAIDTANTEFSADLKDYMKKLEDNFLDRGFGREEFHRFFRELDKEITNFDPSGIKDKLIKTVEESRKITGYQIFDTEKLSEDEQKRFYLILEALKKTGIEGSKLVSMFHSIKYDTGALRSDSWIKKYIRAYEEYNDTLTAINKAYTDSSGLTKEFAESLERAKKAMQETVVADEAGNVLDPKTFRYSREKQNLYINTLIDTIKNDEAWVKAFKQLGLTIDEGWFTVVEHLDPKNLMAGSAINFDAIFEALKDKVGDGAEQLKTAVSKIQKEYLGIVPTDRTVNVLKTKFDQMADAMGVSMDKMQRYLMGAEENIENYAKRIKDAIEGLGEKILEMENINADKAALKPGSFALAGYSEDEIKEAKDQMSFLEKFLGWMEQLLSGGKGGRGDGRVQTLQEIERALTSMLDKYEEVEKRVGAAKASDFVDKTYRQEIAFLNDIGKQFGLKFDVPKTIDELNRYQTEIWNALGKINTKVAQRAMIDLGKRMDARWIKDQTDVVDKRLKELSDRISRTKTAKEFYDKILSQTGDLKLAASLSVSVYGQDGLNLQQELASQLGDALKGVMPDGKEMGINVFEEGIIDPKTFYINYAKLRAVLDKMRDKLPEAQRKLLEDMLKNGEAFNKAQVEQWAKDLEKTKSYTEQYIDLYRMTEKRKAEIRQKVKSGELSEEAGEQEIAGYDARLVKEQQKLQYEAFKNTPTYIALFDDLENATVGSLTAMRAQLVKMKKEWKDLNPTQIKELQSRLRELDEQLATKSPFKVISDGWRTMGDMAKKYGSRSALDEKIRLKQAELDALQSELDAALADEAKRKAEAEAAGTTSAEAAGTSGQEQAWNAYQDASENVKRLSGEIEKADQSQQELTQDAQDWSDAMGRVKKGLKTIIKIGRELLEASDAAKDFAEALGMSEDGLELFQDINNVINKTLDFADALINSVDLMGKTTAQSISTVEKASVILTVISTALQVATAIFNLFSNAKVRKANKEIERQQEILDQLEYTYSRLEKSADKLFGRDYIDNYNQQMRNLQAQAAAYQKQYEAEQSKGKKADEDKLKEYKDAYRDTMDEIADMQSQLAEKFTGTSRTDVARQMAQSWIEAKASMSDTFAAIKSDYAEMIKNMIVEGAAARVIENALSQMWEKMDKMLADNNVEGAIDALVGGMDDALSAANNGMEVLWKALEARGYDMKQLVGDIDDNYTGIKREVGGATSEEMNANTTALNTQNYYLSQMPGIAANVALIRQYLESGGASTSIATAAGWTDWQQQAMDHYAAIQRNTADTVVECRRAAIAAENAVAELQRVIKPRKTPATHSLHVTID